MILKKVEDGVVVSAIEIISFDVQIEDRKATIKIVLDDAQNSEATYYQSPGDKYIYQIVDEFNRELLDIEIDSSLPSVRVIRTLERICEWRGYPKVIRLDNGPEFISTKLELWCKDHNIILDFIRPGKPTENSRVERYNGSFRRELLDCYVFRTLNEVREKSHEWILDYSYHRPHESLGDLSPTQFLERHNQSKKLSA